MGRGREWRINVIQGGGAGGTSKQASKQALPPRIRSHPGDRGREHPQGWEQGEHHSTDPRTAENALPPASRGLRSGGTTERSSAKEISDLLLALDANRASHVRGVMGWGVQNTYLKGFRRRLMACLP